MPRCGKPFEGVRDSSSKALLWLEIGRANLGPPSMPLRLAFDFVLPCTFSTCVVARTRGDQHMAFILLRLLYNNSVLHMRCCSRDTALLVRDEVPLRHHQWRTKFFGRRHFGSMA